MTAVDTQLPLKRASHLKVPPGPPRFAVLGNTMAFRNDPLSFLTSLARNYGNICQAQLLMWPTVVLSHPDYIRHILQERPQLYDKDAPFFAAIRLFIGNGLVSVGGKQGLQQRRLIQPAFHKQHLSSFAVIMTDTTLELLTRWESAIRTEWPIDVAEEMMQLTLSVVGKTLFSTDLSEQSSTISSTIGSILKFLSDYFRLPFPPSGIPTRRNRHFKEAIRRLDGAVQDLIRERSERGALGADLLALLLSAKDVETGEGMSHQQIRDELVTFLVGGSETTATGLAWVWYLLSQHAEVEHMLHEELDSVLAGRVPTIDDIPQLVYTRMIIDEALRLYPPAWLFMRRAAQDDEIGGYHIAQHSFLLVCPYLLHRHPDLWEEPEQFRPERFRPGQAEKYQHGAYIPFGAGSRSCIGNHFALMEMVLVLATVAQRYRLELAPGQVVEPTPLMTLRPSKGMLMYLRSRGNS